MNHFHSGFASELVGMNKEAGKRRQAARAQVGTALRSEKGKQLAGKVVRGLKHGAKGTIYGGLFHKLVDPEASTGQALRSGLGVTAGGHVGSNIAKQLGARGRRAQLISGLVGSALGLRVASKSKNKLSKSDRELLQKSLKKEGQQMVATATMPKRDAMTGATPNLPAQPTKAQREATTRARFAAEESAAKGRREKQEKFQAGVKQVGSNIASKIQGAAKSWMGQKKPSGGGLDFSKYPSLNKSPEAPASRVQPPKPATAGKKPNLSSTGTTNAQRFSSYMP